MDIDEFYDADDRRRQSEEIQFGEDWHDAKGVRYEINWVDDTGELYSMRDEAPGIRFDPFGDVIPERVRDENLTVTILAKVPDRNEVEKLLQGWEEAMAQPDSIGWLVERIKKRHLS